MRLRKEDGSALVIALMVLTVFAVLGIALSTVTIGSHKLGKSSRDLTSAYYIAEAGANIAYKELEDQVWEAYKNANATPANYFNFLQTTLSSLDGKEYTNFGTQSGSQPKATISIVENDISSITHRYTIVSTGEIGENSRTVEMPIRIQWQKQGGEEGFPPMPVTSTIIAKSSVDFQGGSITGDVSLDSQEKESFKFGQYGVVDGDIYSSYEGDLPDIISRPDWRANEPLFKELKHKKLEAPWSDYIAMLDMIKLPDNYEEYDRINDLDYRDDGTYYINSDANLNKINISGGATLKIQNVNKDIHIVVKSLNVSGDGKIIFEGDGKVHFHVLEQFTLSGGGKFNLGGERSLARVYYYGNEPISIANGVLLNSNLLIKNAILTLSGGGDVMGAIITGGETINLSGGTINNAMIYAPKAHVNASGGGQVEGIFVAESFELTGGVIFSFDTFDHGILFPDSTGSGGSAGPGGSGEDNYTLGQLISAQPALEP